MGGRTLGPQSCSLLVCRLPPRMRFAGRLSVDLEGGSEEKVGSEEGITMQGMRFVFSWAGTGRQEGRLQHCWGPMQRGPCCSQHGPRALAGTSLTGSVIPCREAETNDVAMMYRRRFSQVTPMSRRASPAEFRRSRGYVCKLCPLDIERGWLLIPLIDSM